MLKGETAKGKKVEDTLLASVTAKEGGSWKTPSVNPPLEEGQYTVVATEPSGLENGIGKSEERGFEVELGAPKIELNAVSRSRNTEPSFSGTASDKTPVTVNIYEGESATGTIVATATEQGTRKGTEWMSTKASPSLPTGRHTFTAVAVEASELKGNPNGESNAVTFEVDTEAPTVTLNQLETPSNQTKPSFSGAASEATEVMVHVYAGSKVGGSEVDSVTTTAAEGRWSGSLSKALQEGKHTFTAYATEKSAITGNEEGRSGPVTFEVDTVPPTVELNPVPSPANDAQPSFSGTASDTTTVTVSVYEGGTANGNAVATIESEGTGGEWSSGKLGSPRAKGDSTLPNGEYTAVARQPSSLGNPDGESKPVSFVVRTLPPKVVAQPATIVSRTQVQLNASVNPNEGALSACGFEYGTSTGYGRLGRMRLHDRIRRMCVLGDRRRRVRIPIRRRPGARLRACVQPEPEHDVLLPHHGRQRRPGRIGDGHVHHPGGAALRRVWTDRRRPRRTLQHGHDQHGAQRYRRSRGCDRGPSPTLRP